MNTKGPFHKLLQDGLSIQVVSNIDYIVGDSMVIG